MSEHLPVILAPFLDVDNYILVIMDVVDIVLSVSQLLAMFPYEADAEHCLVGQVPEVLRLHHALRRDVRRFPADVAGGATCAFCHGNLVYLRRLQKVHPA